MTTADSVLGKPIVVIKPKRGCRACRTAIRAGKIACWTHFVG